MTGDIRDHHAEPPVLELVEVVVVPACLVRRQVARRDGDRLPAKLKVVFEDDSEEVIEWDDNARWKRFTFTKPVKIRSAQLDPDNIRYLDLNRLDNSRTRDSNPSAVRQFVAATASAAQTFFALMVNL